MNQTTDFGFQEVSPNEKTQRVGEVFSSVASRYDLMNDLMSLGMHHIWKRQSVYLANIKPDARILDIAGGTGDMAMLMRRRITDAGNITVCDINPDMLRRGRDRLLDRGMINGIEYVQGNVECLPFEENSFDITTIAFGLRNVTNKEQALASMYEKIKYGGELVILEFSKIILPFLSRLYDEYSFRVIPWLGKTIADDEDSYKYLVESIRIHPDQDTLAAMMQTAGFDMVNYTNLSNGIVAIHRGFKL